jgi:carboxymethylenebutenolidase
VPSGRSERETATSNQATRKRASDFDPRILEIFDGYVHGRISKREFIARDGRCAAAGVTGAMILEQLQPTTRSPSR